MSAATSGHLLDCRPVIGGQTWKLGRLLGRGGFASVYECVSGNNVRAAVKVIDLSQQSKWAQGKLRSEAENMRRAQRHEHIIELHGEARIAHYHLFVMERWGRDLLESVLEQRGLGEAFSQRAMVQVLRALAWLHEMRICHGDVKPENLLCARVNGRDVVKLADFGSAVQLPENGVAAVDPVAQGTTLYSPPEVLHGQAYSTAADMWAAGITTYVLITGYFPFGCTQDALSSSASFDGEGWRTVSIHAREFIQDLLRHDPSARPTANEALNHAWIRELASERAPESPPRASPERETTLPLGAAPIALPSDADVPSDGQGERREEVTTPTVGKLNSHSPPMMRTPSKQAKRHAQAFAADSLVEYEEHASTGVCNSSKDESTDRMLLRPAKKRLRQEPPVSDDSSAASTSNSEKPISPRTATNDSTVDSGFTFSATGSTASESATRAPSSTASAAPPPTWPPQLDPRSWMTQ